MPDPLIRFLKDLSGIARVQDRLARIADPDATPLMVRWMKVIDDNNRRGVLAGLDKNDVPLVPVTYRPVGPKKGQTKYYKALKYRSTTDRASARASWPGSSSGCDDHAEHR
jgi:hypothetical protein